MGRFNHNFNWYDPSSSRAEPNDSNGKNFY